MEVFAEASQEVFEFNREVFNFNMLMRQRNLHQQQKQRVMAYLLYREDLRDLFNLTIGKMDNYLLMNSLQLGICLEMFYKGRTPMDIPTYLYCAYSIALSTAISFIVLSIAFATHASVCAQNYSARTLTHWLRLPIASPSEIEDAAVKLETFEEKGLHMFRMPILQRKRLSRNNSSDNVGKILSDTNNENILGHDEWEKFTQHFSLFNHLHQTWRTYEAYARVAMCLGTSNLLLAIGYFALCYFTISFKSQFVGFIILILMTVGNALHLHMNLCLSLSEYYCVTILITVPPLIYCIASVFYSEVIEAGNSEQEFQTYNILGILGHVGSLMWHVVLTKLALYTNDTNGQKQDLPVRFSTVWCVDVLGFDIPGMANCKENIHEYEAAYIDVPSFHSKASSKYLDTSLYKTLHISKDLNSVRKKVQILLKEIFLVYILETGDDALKESLDVADLSGGTRPIEQYLSEFKRLRKEFLSKLNANIADGYTGSFVGTSFHPVEGWVAMNVNIAGKINYFLNLSTGQLQWMPVDISNRLVNFISTLDDVSSITSQFTTRQSNEIIESNRFGDSIASDSKLDNLIDTGSSKNACGHGQKNDSVKNIQDGLRRFIEDFSTAPIQQNKLFQKCGNVTELPRYSRAGFPRHAFYINGIVVAIVWTLALVHIALEAGGVNLSPFDALKSIEAYSGIDRRLSMEGTTHGQLNIRTKHHLLNSSHFCPGPRYRLRLSVLFSLSNGTDGDHFVDDPISMLSDTLGIDSRIFLIFPKEIRPVDIVKRVIGSAIYKSTGDEITSAVFVPDQSKIFVFRRNEHYPDTIQVSTIPETREYPSVSVNVASDMPNFRDQQVNIEEIRNQENTSNSDNYHINRSINISECYICEILQLPGELISRSKISFHSYNNSEIIHVSIINNGNMWVSEIKKNNADSQVHWKLMYTDNETLSTEDWNLRIGNLSYIFYGLGNELYFVFEKNGTKRIIKPKHYNIKFCLNEIDFVTLNYSDGKQGVSGHHIHNEYSPKETHVSWITGSPEYVIGRDSRTLKLVVGTWDG